MDKKCAFHLLQLISKYQSSVGYLLVTYGTFLITSRKDVTSCFDPHDATSRVKNSLRRSVQFVSMTFLMLREIRFDSTSISLSRTRSEQTRNHVSRISPFSCDLYLSGVLIFITSYSVIIEKNIFWVNDMWVARLSLFISASSNGSSCEECVVQSARVNLSYI